ncbi:MAG: pyrroloquinoline quinone-dependent dehydrogenase, partial [Acidobacteria bacterium]
MRILRALVVALACSAAAVAATDLNDWPSHDHDAGGQRFSPLKQITPANVSRLQRAWSFDTGAPGIQVTPIVVNGVMYVAAGKDVIALEPETARVIWRYTAPAAVSRRGVAYWPGDRDTPPRLVAGSGDRLMALDAERGKPADGFGDAGFVDLKSSVRGDIDGGFSLASPPAIYKNIIITGGNNGEQSPSFGLCGDIRGWDIRTGRLLWSFHTVPRAGEPGVDTWE